MFITIKISFDFFTILNLINEIIIGLMYINEIILVEISNTIEFIIDWFSIFVFSRNHFMKNIDKGGIPIIDKHEITIVISLYFLLREIILFFLRDLVKFNKFILYKKKYAKKKNMFLNLEIIQEMLTREVIKINFLVEKYMFIITKRIKLLISKIVMFQLYSINIKKQIGGIFWIVVIKKIKFHDILFLYILIHAKKGNIPIFIKIIIVIIGKKFFMWQKVDIIIIDINKILQLDWIE